MSFVPLSLIHSHLPAPPSIPHAIPELRVISDRPFPSLADEDLEPQHPDHAVSATHDPKTGILARAIRNGYVLELRTLNPLIARTTRRREGSESIRIFLPDRLLPLTSDCIVASPDRDRLYILVVTEAAIVYRFSFRLNGFQVGQHERISFTQEPGWCEEYRVDEEICAAGSGVGTYRVIHGSSAVLGASDGGIIRLERTENQDGAERAAYWTAAYHRPSTKFRLPSLFSRSTFEGQVISLATYSSSNSPSLCYAFSRDARLRTWDLDTGENLRTIEVKSSSQQLVPRTDRPNSGTSQHDSADVQHIQVIRHPSASSRYSHVVLVFRPNPVGSSTAGSFLLYRASDVKGGANDLSFGGEKMCSRDSEGARLRGFLAMPPQQQNGASAGWTLYVAWDLDGSITHESIPIDDILQFTTYVQPSNPSPLLTEWQSTSISDEADSYDAAYFDNLLSLNPPDPARPEINDDINSSFISHLFHPNRFSALTLTTALEEYLESLPDHRMTVQLANANSLPTVQQRLSAIIGCHLRIDLSPETGAPMIDIYRRQLKLEWLGIWARARTLDRQARWPLSMATWDGQSFVITREGVSVPVRQDVAGVVERFVDAPEQAADFRVLSESALRSTYPGLSAPKSRSGAIALSSAGSIINEVLSHIDGEAGTSALDELLVALETAVAVGPQEPIESLALRMWDDHVAPYLSDDQYTAVRRTLSECHDVLLGTEDALGLVNTWFSIDTNSANVSARFGGLGKSLVAATISSFIDARQRFAQHILLIALFQIAESTAGPGIDEDTEETLFSLVSRTLTTWHRFRVLKWISDQNVEEEVTAMRDARPHKRKGGGDDLADGLGGLRMGDVSAESDGFQSSSSLLHHLLATRLPADVERGVGRLAESVNNYLSKLDLTSPDLEELDPSDADIRFGNAILQSGLPVAAGHFASLYPKRPGTLYLGGRAALQFGSIDVAVRSFESASNGVADGSLACILPACHGPNGLYEYFRHIALVCSEAKRYAPAVYFGQTALTLSPKVDDSDSQAQALWTSVFLAAIHLRRYEDAYAVLSDTPFFRLRNDFISQLVSEMCEANEVGRLTSLGFVGFTREVERVLVFKAHNSDPLRGPNYYKILYGWYIYRGDYRSAGEIMYSQAKRLAETSSKTMSAHEILARQAASHLAAINALVLVNPRNAWISVAGPPPIALKNWKRRKVTAFIPEEEFDKSRRPVNILDIQDIRAEYSVVLAKLRLAKEVPDLLDQGVSYDAVQIIGLAVQRGQYDLALATAVQIDVDMSEIFISLATRSVELAQMPVPHPSLTAYLQISPSTSRLKGSPAALSLRYIEIALQRHDTAHTQFRYRKAVANTFFALNADKRKGWRMPAWLVQWEMDRDPEGWISDAVKWGWVMEALEWSLELLRRASPPELLPPNRSNVAEVPYNLFDRVIAATKDGDEKNDKGVQVKAKALVEAVQMRVRGLKRLEGR